MIRNALTTACLALALTVVATGTASAASVSYVGADGNVHLISPDGQRKLQVTTDGTAARPYQSPSQADDGTVVAIGFEGEYTKFAMFFDPATGTREDVRLLPHGTGIGSYAGLTGGQVSPDGAFYAYDWIDSDGGVRYATSLIGNTGLQNACAIRCKYGWTSPRWVDNTSSLVLDPYLGDEGVGVQPPGSGAPVPWFNVNGDGSGDGVSSVDESAGRLAVEYVPAGSGSMLDVLIDDPATGLVITNHSGPPGAGLPSGGCALASFSADPAFPRLSPDGSMLAWGAPEGVYVSPTPTGGGTCALKPTLIAPGGSRPDWGRADVPGAGTDTGTADPATDKRCEKAKAKVKKAKKKLKKAKANGDPKKIAKAKKKLKKAKKAAKRACAAKS